jgi:hypothetical protein
MTKNAYIAMNMVGKPLNDCDGIQRFIQKLLGNMVIAIAVLMEVTRSNGE